MELPEDFVRFNIVEVRFKGSRKEYFRNVNNLDLYTGDYVAVESNIGFDIGTVSATGEIVRLQLKKLRIREDSDRIRDLQRMATERDMEKYHEMKARENATLERARTIAFGLNLQMKLSDIEFQADGRKVIFFYTAEQRVDFRELIRIYADEFRTKIEMRHISYREEASRLGGIGVCGRQLCCSTWLTDYKIVTTGAARIQNLSINMEKLAGQCGRLKCCLNYELDLYVESLDAFPKAKVVKLDTVSGMAWSRKTDILKKMMWFSYEDSQTWIALEVDKVKEFMEENRQGRQVPALQDVAAASQVIEQASANAPEVISGAELLEEDLEFEKEMRRQRDGQQRGQQQRGKGDRREGGDRNRNRQPDRRNESRGPRPDNRGPRPENKGPRPDNKGPRPENKGPRPDQRPQGDRPKNRGPRRDNRGPGNNRGPETPDNGN